MSHKTPRVAEDTCTNCGLRIGQVGSFTQWIFRDERCVCETPKLVERGGKSAPNAAAPAVVPIDAIEVELIARQLLDSLIDGRYLVESVIGIGGWGCVLKARHPELGSAVAIKLLHEHLSYDADKVARFKQEAQAARQLKHPNVVPVLDYGYSDGRPYLVMDFLDGHSLSSEIGETGISTERFFEIFEQVLSGVAAAHAAGIVHRDLKPANIFIVSNGPDTGRVKILDFGLAKLISSDGESITNLTQTGATIGTPSYMSPEHCMGKQTDARSDIYSLGCCMYEALSGRKIFTEETVYGWLNAHVSSEPDLLAITNKSSENEPLKNLIYRCLEKDPADRPQSAQQVLEALRNLRSGKRSGLFRRKKIGFANQRQRTLALISVAAGLTSLCAIAMVFSGPIITHLSAELPKLQDKLVLVLPLKREWKRFDVRGTQLMNEGHFKEADEQFAVAESAARSEGNAEQQLCTLERRALVAQILADKSRYESLLQQIEQIKKNAGDASQKQVAEAELAKQALSFVAAHPDPEQSPHVQQLIKAITSAAVILQLRGEYHQSLELLEPAVAKAKSALDVNDPTYAECVLRECYSRLRDAKADDLTTEFIAKMSASLKSTAVTLSKTDPGLAQEADVVRAETLLSTAPEESRKLADAVIALPEKAVSQRIRLKAELVNAMALARLGHTPDATARLEKLIDPISRLCAEDLDTCMKEYARVRYMADSLNLNDIVKEAEGLEESRPLLALNLYFVVLRRMDKDYELAVPLSEKALALAQYQTAPTSRWTDTALDLRARALCALKVKRFRDAEPILKQLLALREYAEDKEQLIVDTKTWLAFIQMNSGNTTAAKNHFQDLARNYQSAPFERMWELSEFVPNLTEHFAAPAEQAALLKRLRERIDALAGTSTPHNTADRLRVYARLQFNLGHHEDALKTQREAAALLEEHTALAPKELLQLDRIVREMAFYQGAAGHAEESARSKAIAQEISAGSFKRGHHW